MDKQEVIEVQNYYTNLDDFEDDRWPPFVDRVTRFVQLVIVDGCILIILGLCAHLEAL